jgi:hypothetical protein
VCSNGIEPLNLVIPTPKAAEESARTVVRGTCILSDVNRSR